MSTLHQDSKKCDLKSVIIYWDPTENNTHSLVSAKSLAAHGINQVLKVNFKSLYG